MNRDDSFENLKTLFAAELAEKIKTLQAAVRDANWDTIGRISHQIRGTAKSFGYSEVSVLAAELEQAVAQKSLDYSADLVKRISDLFVL